MNSPSTTPQTPSAGHAEPALHGYLTGPLAELGAIRVIETTPVLRTLKAL